MRWICWMPALLAVVGLAFTAAGQAPAWGAGPCVSCEKYGTLSAPACASRYLGLTPGCCECPPSGCDNAWATYCCEKARWMPFWHRFGTGAYLHQTGPVVYQSMPTCDPPAVQPLPAVPDDVGQGVEPDKSSLPPLPQPPGERTTRRVHYPWRQ